MCLTEQKPHKQTKNSFNINFMLFREYSIKFSKTLLEVPSIFCTLKPSFIENKTLLYTCGKVWMCVDI